MQTSIWKGRDFFKLGYAVIRAGKFRSNRTSQHAENSGER